MTTKWQEATHKVQVVTAATQAVVRTDASVRRYGPANWIQVVNDDVVNVRLYLDNKEYKIVAGSIWGINNTDGIQFSDIKIKNDDAATDTTADKIEINYGYA